MTTLLPELEGRGDGRTGGLEAPEELDDDVDVGRRGDGEEVLADPGSCREGPREASA